MCSNKCPLGYAADGSICKKCIYPAETCSQLLITKSLTCLEGSYLNTIDANSATCDFDCQVTKNKNSITKIC